MQCNDWRLDGATAVVHLPGANLSEARAREARRFLRRMG